MKEFPYKEPHVRSEFKLIYLDTQKMGISKKRTITADFVMPFFLFLVGVSIGLAFKVCMRIDIALLLVSIQSFCHK
jgi:hypothetical protein